MRKHPLPVTSMYQEKAVTTPLYQILQKVQSSNKLGALDVFEKAYFTYRWANVEIILKQPLTA